MQERAKQASAAAERAGRRLSAALAPELRERLADAMAVHGPFGTLEEYARLVLGIAEERRRAEPVELSLEAVLPPCLADLHLARACARRPRDDRAWHVLVKSERERLVAVGQRSGVHPADQEVDEFLSDLWLPRPSGSCLLETYRGRAPLSAWLNLVFRRRCIRRARAWQPDGEQEIERRLASAVECPVDLSAREELRLALRADLARALAGMRPRDRDFVVARLLGEEPGASLARRHGVSPSFVSHRTTELMERLRLHLSPLLGRFGLRAEFLR